MVSSTYNEATRTLTIHTCTSLCYNDVQGMQGVEDAEQINLPPNIDRLENSVFEEFENLVKIVIPKKVTYVGKNCFRGCGRLKRVTLPEDLKCIQPYTFYECTALEYVYIGEGTQDISHHAFTFCRSLKHLNIPSAVLSIGQYALAHTGLSSVVLPEGIEVIAEGCFLNCEELSRVVIPKVHEIESEAFKSCVKLKHFFIPGSVAWLGHDVFDKSGLKHISVPRGIKGLQWAPFRYWLIKPVSVTMRESQASLKLMKAQILYMCLCMKAARYENITYKNIIPPLHSDVINMIIDMYIDITCIRLGFPSWALRLPDSCKLNYSPLQHPRIMFK